MSIESATAPAPALKKELTVVDSVRKMEPEFAAALPSHITPEKFTRVAVSAINGNPDLLKPDIDKRSLFAAVMKAAQDGLVLDGREAALVIFKKQAQYMPMVAGVLKKMRNSGEISTISTGIVYKNEYEAGRFKYVKGDTESLSHDPILFQVKGDQIGVYAVVTLKDGGKIREFMDMGQIAKVRKTSRSGGSEYSPWNTWFEEMCIKSVLKKVAKLCPQSTDIEQILNDDDDTPASSFSAPPVINAGGVEAGEGDQRPKRQTRAAAVVKGVTAAPPAPVGAPAQSTRDDVMDAEFTDVTGSANRGETVAADPTPSSHQGHGEEPPM